MSDASLFAGIALATAWAVAGVFLLTKDSRRRLGAVLLLGSVVGAAGLVSTSASGAGSVGAVLATALLPAVGLHVLVGVPDGHVRRRARRVGVVAGYLAAAMLGAVCVVADREVEARVTSAAWIVATCAGVSVARPTYRRATGIERRRLQLLGCGAALAAEVVLVVVALDRLVDWPARPGVVAAIGAVALPAAFAAGTSDRVVNRVDRLLVSTVSIAGLTLVTVGVYVLVVVGLGGGPDDGDRSLVSLSMAAAAVTALLYAPARARLAEVANRLAYGARRAPDEVLQRFGSRLSRSTPMDELLLQLAESLKKTLDLTRAEVWTGTPALVERTVSVPFAGAATLSIGDDERAIVARAGITGRAWAAVWLPALLEGRADAQLRIVPAVHAGQLLGLLVVERAADGDDFTDDEDTLLVELARQVGLALHNAQLDSALQATLDEVRLANEELRASRARVVTSGDAERRRIERNLHDGAQQHLVALAVNLRVTKDLITEDQAAALEMIDQLASAVKETIGELRALAHGIFPALLVDAGLGEALRAAGVRSPLDVVVDVGARGRYGPEIEAAVYFCCVEALQNAGKHAPGAQVSLRVWDDDGWLRFEVADDGPGFDAGTAGRDGHGFTNMSDRLGAIGGSVRWDAASGAGTRITGSVPVPTA